MSLGFQYFKKVKRPGDGPGTQVRFNFAFILWVSVPDDGPGKQMRINLAFTYPTKS